MATPTPWNGDTLVNTAKTGNQHEQKIAALGDGRYVVVWTDANGGLGDASGSAVKGQIFNADGSKAGGEFLVNKTGTAGDQRQPDVVIRPDGGFTVVWQTVNNGNKADVISGRNFNAAGAATGSEFEIGTASSPSYGPTIYAGPTVEYLSTGKMVVSWDIPQGTGLDHGLRVQVLNSNGSKSGDPTSYVGPAYEAGATVVPLADGRFMLAWTSYANDAKGDVRGQIFTGNGTKVGGEFTINTGKTDAQYTPQFETLSDGRILCVWRDNQNTFTSLKGQFFTASGAKSGGEFTVNNDGQVGNHDMTALPDGGFVVTWNTGGHNADSFAQRYDASGAKIGEKFQIHKPAAGEQLYPMLTTLADGRIAFTFTDKGKQFGDTDGTSVVTRIFDPRTGGIAFFGTDGNDQRVGTKFVDILSGGKGNDIFHGGGGNDSLTGGDGDDELYGEGGHDSLTGGAGADWLHGGEGVDTAWYIQSDAGVKVNLLTTTGSGGHAQGDRLFSIENLVGSVYDDVLAGNGSDNVLEGRAGKDDLYGGKGNDILIGGAGADKLDGGEDNDTASYATSNAAVAVSLKTGKGLFGDAQGDTLKNIENLVGSNYNDLLIGNEQVNALAGGLGDDWLDGGGGADFLVGGKGSDTFVVYGEGETIYELAGEGIDEVRSWTSYTLGANLENLTLLGIGPDGRHAIGNSLANVITGSTTSDILDGKGGKDILRGMGGHDLYLYEDLQTIVDESVAGSGGIDTIETSTQHIFLTAAAFKGDIENVVLKGAFDLKVQGNALDNSITGNDGDNWLNGGAGWDTMAGGKGNDTYIVDDAGDVVIENAGEGDDHVISSVSWTLGNHVETLTLTGVDHLKGVGNGLDNAIHGNYGNNTLDGKAGADEMLGGLGDDIYIVDNAGDVVIEYEDEGIDMVRSSVSWTLDSHIENLVLTGSATINGTGNDLANVINGNSADNVLDGKAGADMMIGGLGDDTYHVDDAGDVVVEKPGQGTDTVVATVSHVLSAHVEMLILAGAAAIDGSGNDLANVIAGNSAANAIDGKLGSDILSGGAGKDDFAFTTALSPDNVDTITDFNPVDDTIVLDKAIFIGLAAGTLASSAIKNVNNGPVDSNDRILYDKTTGALFFDRDGSGSTYEPVQFAVLENKPNIGAADFFVV